MENIKIAYIVQCHMNPHQINRLILQLIDENADVYVHVDKKSRRVREYIIRHPQVYILSKEESEKVYWSDISQVKATLRLTEKVFSSGKIYDYIYLLSGQDFPIKTKKQIYNVLLENKGKAFINMQDFYLFSKRTDVFYPRWMLRRAKIIRAIKRVWVEITGGKNKTYKIFKRKALYPKYYYGSSWWCLPYECLKEIYSMIMEDKRILEFFTHSLCSDECVFQTLVMQSTYKDKLLDCLTYADWSRGKIGPETLIEKDLERLKNGSFLFARKFNEKIDSTIIDRIEKMITEQ